MAPLSFGCKTFGKTFPKVFRKCGVGLRCCLTVSHQGKGEGGVLFLMEFFHSNKHPPQGGAGLENVMNLIFDRKDQDHFNDLDIFHDLDHYAKDDLIWEMI